MYVLPCSASNTPSCLLIEMCNGKIIECCYCGSESLVQKTVLERRNAAYGAYKCSRCALVQVHPRPTDEFLERLYADSYSRDIPNKRAIRAYQRTANVCWKLSKKTVAGGALEDHARPRLLDVGCNLGFFLCQAAALGFVTAGIDISQAAVDFVNERSIGFARKATVEEYAALSNGRFEVVTSFDVIEHVANPRSFLDGACALVRTGGILAIGTPNVDSTFARLNFETWYYTDPPFHINYFGMNLVDFVEMRGFKLVRSRYMFAPSMITQYLGIGWKILEKGKAGCVSESHNNEEGKESAARKIVESSFDALNVVASWLRVGDSMLLFFRKTP